jgi:hypothetical protein
MWYGCNRGESSEGCGATGKSPVRGSSLARVLGRDQKRGEPHDRLGGATNPRTADAEKTVEAGRNSKDGTCLEGGISKPKVARAL